MIKLLEVLQGEPNHIDMQGVYKRVKKVDRVPGITGLCLMMGEPMVFVNDPHYLNDLYVR